MGAADEGTTVCIVRARGVRHSLRACGLHMRGRGVGATLGWAQAVR